MIKFQLEPMKGVENETLSVETGVVASALALNETSSSISSPVKIKTLGGD